jgi:PAS domain S-box-containing protein
MGEESRTGFSSIPTAMPRSGRRRLLLSLVVGVCGILLSWFFAWLLHTRERQVAEIEFRDHASGSVQAIEHTVVNRLGALRTLAAFYAGSNAVERDEFATFSEALLERYHEIEVVGWAPRVRAAERRSFEEAVERDGFPHYKIVEPDGDKRFVSAAARSEYCPVLFIEPFAENKSEMGLDLRSHAGYRAAMDRAATGRPAIWIKTAAGAEDELLLCVVMPATMRRAKAASPNGQQPQTGFIFGVFRLRPMVQGALTLYSDVGRMDVAIVAPQETHGERSFVMRFSPGRTPDAAAGPSTTSAVGMDYKRTIRIAGSDWSFNCRPAESFLAREQSGAPLAVLLGGLLLTGLLVGYLWLLTGRTARVEQMVAERTKALGESEERFRRLVDNAGDSFFLRDGDKILDVSKRACDSLGYSREELLGMTIADIDVRYDAEQRRCFYARLSEQDFPVTFEGVQRRKDGTTFPVEVRSTPLDVGGRRLYLSLVRDVTERKRAEEELQKEQQLLRAELDLHERDRKLVSYEIHDGLAQLLVGALYKFQAIEHVRQEDPAAAQTLFDEALRVLRQATVETRRLISGLRPPILEESGVIAALDYMISEQRQQGGPAIELVHPAEFPRLAAPLEGAIFRTVQECLTNACRHSQSEKVRVEVELADGRVNVEVRDWGVGFDPAQVEGSHFGLQGIRQRAQLLGGAATIESAPGQGTRIRVAFPSLAPIENGIA